MSSPATTITEETLYEEALFEISFTSAFGTETVYAEEPEGVIAAIRVLRKQAPHDIQGRKQVVIRDLSAGIVIYSGDERIERCL